MVIEILNRIGIVEVRLGRSDASSGSQQWCMARTDRENFTWRLEKAVRHGVPHPKISVNSRKLILSHLGQLGLR